MCERSIVLVACVRRVVKAVSNTASLADLPAGDAVWLRSVCLPQADSVGSQHMQHTHK